jgi:hypothetical protein
MTRPYKLSRTFAAATMMLFALTRTSTAQVTAFSNFGPGDSFDWQAWTSVVGPDRPESQWVAMDFVPSVSGVLTQLRLALEPRTDFHPLSVRITDNLDPALAGFEEWNFESDEWGGPPVDLVPVNPYFLIAGHSYFVQVSAVQDEILRWHHPAGLPNIGNVYFSFNEGDNWSKEAGPRSAFKVTVNPTAVPEASSVALMCGTAPLGLYWLMRRRRRPVS